MEISPCTNAVVAICVVLVVAAAVGAVGVPVNAGDAIGAKSASVQAVLNCAKVQVIPTILV